MVPVDPTFGQMRRVVCGDLNPLPSLAPTMFNPSADPDNTENTVVPTSLSNSLRDQSAACRPPISRRWVQDPYLSRMTQIMQECWHQHWSARLPALRVRKTIEMLEQTLHRSTSGIAGTTTAIGDVVLDEPEYRQCEIQSMRRFDSSLTDI
ncbi:hypothetical protein D915_009767 [Fasciola hepatica]|uniref:Serine-threonine/tyrosine-protein kinase catalytic domain-containing protein n=1 Tax=Fasciola hepatica TaxID=6192 RepID=A0A2H1BWJ2_FASHE|nr:hypothetical protein D915_009767 [Fasciola hepatica]